MRGRIESVAEAFRSRSAFARCLHQAVALLSGHVGQSQGSSSFCLLPGQEKLRTDPISCKNDGKVNRDANRSVTYNWKTKRTTESHF